MSFRKEFYENVTDRKSISCNHRKRDCFMLYNKILGPKIHDNIH